ncbi:unnamed protein product [Clavelina lepadiformis]|uniref:Telomere length regulation protein TEL2 homolog n=1 Tax=Clavelina lepadiformis TaxID=159417 RepID=A0ABP0GVH7_CLALP
MSTASANRSTRVCIREWINKLESNEYESRVTSDCLLHLIKQKVTKDDEQLLSALLENIINHANHDWISSLYSEVLVFDLLKNLPSEFSFLLLMARLHELSIGSRLEFVVSVLEKLFIGGCYRSLLVQESNVSTTSSHLWSKMITCIGALPDHVANKFQNPTKFRFFHSETFFIFLGVEIAQAISTLADVIKNGKEIKTEFISLNIGHFCLLGKAEYLFKALYPALITHCESNFLWQRIVQKCFLSVPDRQLESVLTFLFKHAPIPHCLPPILGDMVTKKAKAKYIILHKLLLLSNLSETTAAENVIGYISRLSNATFLLTETIKKLLEAWGNKSSIKHTTYQQHKYLTASILVCVGHLSRHTADKQTDGLLEHLMAGMRYHLESPDMKIRKLGMIVGEKVTELMSIPTKKDAKLLFEYDCDDETVKLISLCDPEDKPTSDFYQSQLNLFEKFKDDVSFKADVDDTTYSVAKSSFMEMAKAQKLQLTTAKDEEDNTSFEFSRPDDEVVDSDDELTPYNLPEEAAFSKASKPMYIRDCLEGLIDHKNQEEMEFCLTNVTHLVEVDVVAAKEIAVELFKVILNLQDNYAIDNFVQLRRSALCAVLVCNPKEVAEYVTMEFYSEHYNLQQRMDMLDVLVMSAGRLSTPETDKKGKNSEVQLVGDVNPDIDESSLPWQQVVEKRIEAKTKRFGKPRKPAGKSNPDQFGPVAGYFFYPLMSGYDRRIRTLDLLGEDSIILGRLLYALGTILYSTANSLVVEKMASSLLEFVAELRHHLESFVRKACIYCVSMATVSVPNVTRLLSSNAFDCRQWLCDVIKEDDDEDTRRASANALGLLDAKVRVELGMQAT